MTATLSPLHWKETHPRCFGISGDQVRRAGLGQNPETSARNRPPGVSGILFPKLGSFLGASDGDAVAVTLERNRRPRCFGISGDQVRRAGLGQNPETSARNRPPGVSGILFPKLGSFLGASDGDAVAVTLERNRRPRCFGISGDQVRRAGLGQNPETSARNRPPGVSGILFPKLGSFLGASGKDLLLAYEHVSTREVKADSSFLLRNLRCRGLRGSRPRSIASPAGFFTKLPCACRTVGRS